jgi:hypothetical protein
MKRIFTALAIALLAATTAIAADTFDGSHVMACVPTHGHDCLPTESSCKPLKPEKDRDLNYIIDVAGKSIKSPFKTALLKIDIVGSNRESLVLQGTTLQLVWSATVHRATGRLTIVVADREGAYVAFGQCQLANAKQASEVDKAEAK